MNKSLYKKFLLAYLVFGIVSFAIISSFASDYTIKRLTAERAEDMYKEANLLASKYGSAYYRNLSSVATVQTNLSAIATAISAEIWIADPDGSVLIDSEGTPSSLNPLIIEGFDPTSTGSLYYQVGDFYGMFPDDVLSVYAPITSNFSIKGYILIHTHMSDLYAERDNILNISYLSLTVIFSLSLIILGVFTWVVYIPLKKITLAANEYAKGNLKYELKVDGEDEIGYLAASLNYMSSELSKSEEYQKKFISNISHDFRSPLTSIKGYLEAILDGTIPPEMQEKYLNIVLVETERLNKLTSSLLTLNDFDSKKNILDITDFDINAIIKSTAASFEGTCTSKKIRIELGFSSKSLYASADMGKIQQVLYNLLDNAIKFSNNDAVIYVETREKNEKIFVSVKDTGIGIPRDSLKKIWERFYKTDLSRGKDKKGTGLGLSIVKEIIQSHGEHINVISTEGVGTEFVFTLPKSKKQAAEA